jgi:hypothetical protein
MGSKKTTTKTTPWGPGEPYIKDSLAGLQAANQNSTAALQKFTPTLDAAIGKATDTMNNPPQYLTDARTQLDKTINGDYLGKNPYSGGLADLIAQKTGAQYNSTFGGAGRSTGGLAALLSGQGIGDALQQFYSNQYNTDRALQQNAISAAPGFHQDEYTDANAAANLINGRVMLPLNAANAYGSGVTAVTSPYNTSTTTEKANKVQQGIGLAMMAAGAATGNPMMIQGGLGMAGGGMGGMAGLLPPPVSGNMGGINLGGGTSNFFAQNPFAGISFGG